MRLIAYNRRAAAEYARKWALSRNPAYFNFDEYNLGGDCTNFVSQCLFAGGAPMSLKGGWFYKNLNNRGPAWSGVENLYLFLTSNKDCGPYGHIAELSQAEAGDIVQLSFDGKIFSHSLLITTVTAEGVLVSAHTFDCVDRPLNTYFYSAVRVIRIDGARLPDRK